MSEPQEITELQARYQKLSTARAKADALMQQASAELERLKREAAAKFGTDDLAELQAKLEAMEQENLKKRREYQKLLDSVEEELRAIEERDQEGQ